MSNGYFTCVRVVYMWRFASDRVLLYPRSSTLSIRPGFRVTRAFASVLCVLCSLFTLMSQRQNKTKQNKPKKLNNKKNKNNFQTPPQPPHPTIPQKKKKVIN